MERRHAEFGYLCKRQKLQPKTGNIGVFQEGGDLCFSAQQSCVKCIFAFVTDRAGGIAVQKRQCRMQQFHPDLEVLTAKAANAQAL